MVPFQAFVLSKLQTENDVENFSRPVSPIIRVNSPDLRTVKRTDLDASFQDSSSMPSIHSEPFDKKLKISQDYKYLKVSMPSVIGR